MIATNPDATQHDLWVRDRDVAKASSLPAISFHPEGGGADPLVFTLSAGDRVTSGISIPLPMDEWTKHSEHEFLALAKKFALGLTSAEEQSRLESLQATRRRFRNPRTGEEVIWEFTQRQVTRKLVDALQEYVQFHNAAGSAWAGAKQNV